MLDGATAGNLSLAQAYIADNTKPENRARSFAIIGIAFGLGFFLGPSMAGYLSQYGLHAPFYVAAGLSLLSIVCTVALLPNQAPAARPQRRRRRSRRRAPRAHRLGHLRAVLRAPGARRPAAAVPPLRLRLHHLHVGLRALRRAHVSLARQPFTPREIGYLFAYAGFLGIILQGGLIGRLVKRFGEPMLVTAGFVSMGAGFILLGFTDEVPMLIVVATLVAFGHGVLRPTLTSLISQNADPSEQGVVLGLGQSLTSIALVLAPPLGGWLIGMGHLSSWAFVAAAASALGWLAKGWGSSRAMVLRSAE